MQISVVVIGRNEGERLRLCLESVLDVARLRRIEETIYVDSGSTDGSAQLARELGFRVIELDDQTPSAAKARDAGWRAARCSVVLFLDGDCRLDRDFLAAAEPVLAPPEVAAVFGRVHEQFPDRNPFHHVMELHWRSRPPGPAKSAPGCLLVKRQDIESVNGYRTDLLAGEDTDLSFRIVRSGREVIGLDRPMVWHDVSMARITQHWTRFMRAGYADARLREIYGDELTRSVARRRRIRLRLAGVAVALAALATPWPWAAPMLVAAPVASEAVRAQSHGRRWYSGLLFGAHLHFSTAAMVCGRIRRARDRSRRLSTAFKYK